MAPGGDAYSFFDGLFEAVVGVFNGFFGAGVQAGGDCCNYSCRNRVHASPFWVGTENVAVLEKEAKMPFINKYFKREQA
jgi:hypothetical protein